ncbi:penicillin-binding protein 1C [Salmonella enterica subsp. enterica]|nr:penicillin-binding protein 1C [Salmonella enterica subsp. enterica]
MQVARLLDPHSRTFGGKIRQLWRALQLEWHLSKRDILTLYLNRAPFGGTLQGIGAASWAYFGKPPARLSYADAALLAVLPQAPSRLRPDRWPARAEAARNKVLDRMAAQGVWPAETVRESREEPVWLAPRQMPQLAPLFARMMLSKSQNDKNCDHAGRRVAAATGRSGAGMERAAACTQFVGDDRRRSYRYERARLGRIGRP